MGPARGNITKNRFLRCILYYNMFLGLISVRYDLKRHCVRESRPLKVYCLVHNAAMLVLLPFAVAFNLKGLDLYSPSSLMRYTNIVNVCWRAVGFVVTLALRWQQEAKLVRLVHDLRVVHCDLDDIWRRFGRAPLAQSRLHQLLYVNVVVMCYHCLVMFLEAAHAVAADQSALNIAITCHLCVSINHIYLVLLQHAGFLCYFYERFVELNAQLEEMMRCSPTAAALTHICRLHAALLDRLKRFNACFQLQVLCVFITLFMNNATTAYYFVMARVLQLEGLYIFLGGSLYLLSLITLFNYIAICEHLVSASQQPAFIMQQFTQVPHMEVSLARAWEVFLVRLQRGPTRIQICGMFNIDYRSAFGFMQQILLYTIILVQNDYNNI